MRKTIAITGVAGFLGSHLCRRCLRDGHKVIGIDNFSTGSRKNIKEFFIGKDFGFIEEDISNSGKYLWSRYDYIFHLASPASPIEYVKMPIETVSVNTSGTLNLLVLAKETNARILFASTSEIYGDALISPQDETYFGNVNPFGIRSCYDESKRLGETLMYIYKTYHGVDVRVARLFNSFGENMKIDDGRAVPTFFAQAIRKEPITIFGDGTQTRSFTYVDDTIDGLMKLMESDYSSPVNIGNDEEITLNQLAKEIIEITGSDSEIIYKELPEDDPKQRKPDISLAKEVLGWEPKVNRVDGLNITYQYFLKQINGNSR